MSPVAAPGTIDEADASATAASDSCKAVLTLEMVSGSMTRGGASDDYKTRGEGAKGAARGP